MCAKLFHMLKSVGKVEARRYGVGRHRSRHPGGHHNFFRTRRDAAFPWPHLVLCVANLNRRVAPLHYQRQQEESRATANEVPQCLHCGLPDSTVSIAAELVVVRQSTARLASHKPPATSVKNSAHVTSPGRFGKTSRIRWKA